MDTPRRQVVTSQSCAQFWNSDPGPQAILPRPRPALAVKHPVDEPAQHLSGLPTGALGVVGGGDEHRRLVERANEHLGQRPHRLTSQLAGPRQLSLSLRTEVTTAVAARLPEFDKPALIAWSADDVFFALENGQRLAATIPRARFEVIEGARTFSMVDSPDRLADQLSTVAVRT